MSTTIAHLLVIAAAVLTAASAAAQAPAQQPATAQDKSAQGGAPAEGPAPQSFSYEPAGRRDPFLSLLRRGSDPRGATNRPAGVPGLAIAEVTVKGIIKDRSGFIAMSQGPDAKQTYVVRAGEKLMDGTVKAITADGVVFSQDVNDPLSMVKQKEIRKTVRAADGGRG